MQYKFKHGWKKDKLDIRDYSFNKLVSYKSFSTVNLPSHVNLRRYCSYIEDQSDLGSCTGQALVGLMEYNLNINKKPYRDLSRLFVYYNERDIENSINEDSGAEIRDGIKSLASKGVCSEHIWPYDISKFRDKPSDIAFKQAEEYKIHSYYRINGLEELKISLYNKHPVVFGFLVYESFMTHLVANTGIMPMPDVNKEEILGGHAILAVGYSDYYKRILIRNSWGNNWGLLGTNAGYFTMPYEYITPQFTDDFWTITL